MSSIHAPEFPEGFVWFNIEHPLTMKTDLRGRVVVLDFWTYCCINCMHVLPDLEYLEQKYARDPVVIIGVHSNKYANEAHAENIRQAVLRYGITHPVVVDVNHRIWGDYAVSAWPTLMLIDPNGYLIGALPGEGHREELDHAIIALLDAGHANYALAEGPLPMRLEQPPQPASGLLFPGKVLADPAQQRLFIADSGHDRILMTDWTGELQGIFGSGIRGLADGAGNTARFHNPQGMAILDGALVVADTNNHAVRRIDLSSFRVDTILGNGMIGYDRRGGRRGREQLLNSPWDVAAFNGLLYVAMAGLHQIWTYDPQTGIARVAIGTGRENITDNPAPHAALAQPSGLAAGEDALYFADSETSAIRRYDPQLGLVSTLVGQGLFIFGDTDGPEGMALMQHPLGVTVDGDTLYAADSYNHKIRQIDLSSRKVITLAGTGMPGRQTPDHALALYEPGGLSVAGQELFIADTNNHRILRCQLATGAWNEVTPHMGGQAMREAA